MEDKLRRLDELTREWTELRAGIIYVEASQRALLDKIQELKEEEEAFMQSLSLATPEHPRLSLLPVEVLNKVISFLLPREQDASDSDYPKLRFELYELHADCTARTVLPRYAMDLSLPVKDGTTLIDTGRLCTLKSKGATKFNVLVSGPPLPFANTIWHDANITEALANDTALRTGLQNLNAILSIPDRIGRVQFSLQRPARAILPILEALGPHLWQLEELTMDYESYHVNSVEGLSRLVRVAVTTALERECNRNIRLRRCSLEYSLLKPLADAGLLCSVTHLQIVCHYELFQTQAFASLKQGLLGLHSLQVLDLDGDADPQRPADELTHPMIHLKPTIHSLNIPYLPLLKLFFTDSRLLRLGISVCSQEDVGAAFDDIVEKFPALEELRMVSLQTSSAVSGL